MNAKYSHSRSFGARSSRSKIYPKPISGLVDKIIRSLGMTERYNGTMVMAQWDQLVGEDVARNSKAIRCRDGVLTVAVHDAVWRQEISMQIDMFLEKIHSLPYGRKVRRIQLVSGEKRID